MCKTSLNVCLGPKAERNSQSCWTGLGAVAFHPGKLHTESTKYKQELKANKGFRAEYLV